LEHDHNITLIFQNQVEQYQGHVWFTTSVATICLTFLPKVSYSIRTTNLRQSVAHLATNQTGPKCAPARAEVRHAHAGAPDTLQCMSGVHRTVRCTIRQTASTQTASLVVGAINTPTTPHSSHPSFPLLNHLQELGIQF
jgi:hypothetical protein